MRKLRGGHEVSETHCLPRSLRTGFASEEAGYPLMNRLILTMAVVWLAASLPVRAQDTNEDTEKSMKAAVAKVAPCVVRIETSGGQDLIVWTDRATGAPIRKVVGPTTGLDRRCQWLHHHQFFQLHQQANRHLRDDSGQTACRGQGRRHRPVEDADAVENGFERIAGSGPDTKKGDSGRPVVVGAGPYFEPEHRSTAVHECRDHQCRGTNLGQGSPVRRQDFPGQLWRPNHRHRGARPGSPRSRFAYQRRR